MREHGRVPGGVLRGCQGEWQPAVIYFLIRPKLSASSV